MVAVPGEGPQSGQETQGPGSAWWRPSAGQSFLKDKGFVTGLTAHEKEGEWNPDFLAPSPELLNQTRVNFSLLSGSWRKQSPMWSSVFHPCPTGQCLTSILGTSYVPSQPLQTTLFPCNILWNKWWRCSTHIRLLSMFSALVCLFVHHFSPKSIKATKRHTYTGTSLVIQRLRLYTLNAGTSGSIPGYGTKNPHDTQHNWI